MIKTTIISNNELKSLRMKLMFIKLETEVILNELETQREELKEFFCLSDLSKVWDKDFIIGDLLLSIKNKKELLFDINTELKNIKLISEFNTFTII